MKLSTKGRYGLRAILDIARNQKDGPVSVVSISSRQGISERYLEQLLPKLRKGGFVTAVRGAGGGYVLTRPPEQISAGDVLRAMEGELRMVDCGGLYADAAESCEIAGGCATKHLWKKINDAIRTTVDSVTLEELLRQGECPAEGEVLSN